MIGLDTCTIIDIFKGNEKAKEVLQSNQEPYVATMMSYLELFFGIDPENKKHTLEAEYYRDFFNKIQTLDLSGVACEQASKIFWTLKKQGKIIEEVDCAIAGILIANGITKIITRNAKHFEKIKQLSVISY